MTFTTSLAVLWVPVTLSFTASNLSVMTCVALRTSAVATQPSSFVSLLNLFSTCFRSFLPISFFTNFSEYCSVNSDITHTKSLTHSAMRDLLCRNPKNRDNLNHYLDDCICPFRCQQHSYVDLKMLEKTFNPFKKIYECILVSQNTLGCLGDVGIIMAVQR